MMNKYRICLHVPNQNSYEDLQRKFKIYNISDISEDCGVFPYEPYKSNQVIVYMEQENEEDLLEFVMALDGAYLEKDYMGQTPQIQNYGTAQPRPPSPPRSNKLFSNEHL